MSESNQIREQEHQRKDRYEKDGPGLCRVRSSQAAPMSGENRLLCGRSEKMLIRLGSQTPTRRAKQLDYGISGLPCVLKMEGSKSQGRFHETPGTLGSQTFSATHSSRHRRSRVWAHIHRQWPEDRVLPATTVPPSSLSGPNLQQDGL